MTTLRMQAHLQFAQATEHPKITKELACPAAQKKQRPVANTGA